LNQIFREKRHISARVLNCNAENKEREGMEKGTTIRKAWERNWLRPSAERKGDCNALLEVSHHCVDETGRKKKTGSRQLVWGIIDWWRFFTRLYARGSKSLKRVGDGT